MNNENVKNGEILFVYEAKMANPNGDPDNENIPRMDFSTNTNLVSDVRLKRYIRDYFIDNGNPEKDDIFVKRVSKVQNATERAKEFNLNGNGKVEEEELRQNILEKCIDIRMFGATITLKAKKESDSPKEKGSSIQLTGPIQFSWGYSLNKVEIVNSNSITTTFSSEQGKSAGSMGKDYRVYYSIIAFYGTISAKRAIKANLSLNDIGRLDEAIIKSIPSQPTRTKIGQTPLLYLRTEYDSPSFIGDLRDYIELKPKVKESSIRSRSDYSLDLYNLNKILNIKSGTKVAKFWKHGSSEITGITGKEEYIESSDIP